MYGYYDATFTVTDTVTANLLLFNKRYVKTLIIMLLQTIYSTTMNMFS